MYLLLFLVIVISDESTYPRVLPNEILKVIILILLQITIKKKPIYAEKEKIMIAKTEYIINTFKFI